MRPNKRKLQAMIDRCVKHQNAYHRAQAELNNYCAEIYGKEPGEVDADSIIDAVFGGSGVSDGMTADEFDREMRSLTGE